MNILVRMDGKQCYVAMPDNVWMKVKVYVNGVNLTTLTIKDPDSRRRTMWHIPWTYQNSTYMYHLRMHQQDTLRIDAYDGNGKVQLLSVEYILTDERLTFKGEINGGNGVQVVIEP